MNTVQRYAPALQKVLLFGLIFILFYLSFQVLKYFIVPVLWAAIIAYITWPLYHSVQKLCGPRPTLSAYRDEKCSGSYDWTFIRTISGG